jgi:hypothetical protein
MSGIHTVEYTNDVHVVYCISTSLTSVNHPCGYMQYDSVATSRDANYSYIIACYITSAVPFLGCTSENSDPGLFMYNILENQIPFILRTHWAHPSMVGTTQNIAVFDMMYRKDS